MTAITSSIPTSTFWSHGTPIVADGGQRSFWCAVRLHAHSNLTHRFLVYCHRYVMPLSDDCYDPPAGVTPVPDGDGDYHWTGWFEASCDQCETQWCYTGEVVAWMELPRYQPLS